MSEIKKRKGGGGKKSQAEDEKKEIKEERAPGPAGGRMEAKGGLVNGRGLINGRGLVNGRGLINGSGLINGRGLTNGASMVNGKYVDMRQLIKRGYVNGEKLNVVKSTGLFDYDRGRKLKRVPGSNKVIQISVITVIILVIFIPFVMQQIHYPGNISIDGDFSDWINRNSTIVVENNMIYLHFTGLKSGEGSYIYAVLSSTNGSIASLGNLSSYTFKRGDILIAFSRAPDGTPKTATYRVFEGGNPLDANSWGPPIDMRYAFRGYEAEVALYTPPDFVKGGKLLTFGVDRSGVLESVIPPASTWTKTSLVVEESWIAPEKIMQKHSMLFAIQFHAYGEAVSIKGVKLAQPGYANTPAHIEFSVPGVYNTSTKIYMFNTPLLIREDETKTIIVSGEFEDLNGTTVYYKIERVFTDSPYVITPVPIEVSYVGNPGERPKVDGGFEEWRGSEKDALNDTLFPSFINSTMRQLGENADIDEFGKIESNNATYFYVSVSGEILKGAYIGRKDGLTRAMDVHVPPESPKEGAVVDNDLDVVYIGIDEDNNINTGKSWMGIGADYLVEVRGKMQTVTYAGFERWNGSGWVDTGERVEVAISSHGLELSLPERLSGSYVVYVDNWLGVWDSASLLGRATRATVTSKVVLNEIYIGDDGKMQWVEICNPTSEDVDISGWKIVVSTGLSGTIVYTYRDGTVISANNGLNVDASKLDENVSGRIVALLDSSDNVIDSITMPSDSSSHIDKSYGRYADSSGTPTTDWDWMTPTYDKTNPQEIPEFSTPSILMLAILIGGVYGIRKRKEKGKKGY